MEVFDYDINNPENDCDEFECNVCGTYIDKEGICDSRACFIADNN